MKNRQAIKHSHSSKQPINIDIFNPELPAWNMLITGSTGTGKSYILDQLILKEYWTTQRHKVRPKVALITIDSQEYCEHYKNLMPIGPKAHIIDEKFRINPFDLTHKQKYPNSKKILSLKNKLNIDQRSEAFMENLINNLYLDSFFLEQKKIQAYFTKNYPQIFNFFTIEEIFEETVLKAGNCVPHEHSSLGYVQKFISFIFKKELSLLNESLIDDLINDLYSFQTEKYPMISDLNEVIESMKSIDDDWKIALRKSVRNWTKNGDKPYFDTKNFTLIQSEVNVFNVDHQMSKESLEAILLVLDFEISSYFKQSDSFNLKIYENIIGGKITIENETLIDNLRTSRKNRTAVIVVSQSLDDLPQDNEFGRSILSNIQHQIFAGDFTGNNSFYQVNEVPVYPKGLGVIKKFKESKPEMTNHFLYLK